MLERECIMSPYIAVLEVHGIFQTDKGYHRVTGSPSIQQIIGSSSSAPFNDARVRKKSRAPQRLPTAWVTFIFEGGLLLEVCWGTKTRTGDYIRPTGSSSTGYWSWQTRLKNLKWAVSMGGSECGVTHSRYWTEVILYFNYNPFSCVITWRKTLISWWLHHDASTWPGRDRNYLNSTYVIERSLSFTIVNVQRSTFINDMKRIYKTVFKSKKPSLGPIHGTSTSTSTGTSDLMPSIPACDSESDGTASAQLTAGVTVSAQPRPSQL